MLTKYKTLQSGRSMVEMLGVLAVIGVLSVGGIAGYTSAMTKFKKNKMLDQMAMLASGIRTLYGNSQNYSGIDTPVVVNFGIVDEQMLDRNASGASNGKIKNVYNGMVYVKTGVYKRTADTFWITFANLPQDACVAMVTADWGGASGSGLVRIAAGTNNVIGVTASGSSVIGSIMDNNLSVSMATATAACSGPKNFVALQFE
ncbi:MAG: type 4 pilus major pilin [Rhodospirillales bacterium]|nr:type 4 pilus major pilin [Rhodospirillales bacterium]